jgi:glutathione S-transferase
VIRLLGRATSGNVQKVLWMLGETGVEHRREDYGRQFNNTGGDYLQLNPNAKVPTLVDGDLVIWESNTILRYLANRYAPQYYGTDPGKRSHVERWMDWQLATLDQPYLGVFREYKNAADKRTPAFAAGVTGVTQALAILDGELKSKPWLAGNEMSAAEFSLAPIVHRCLNFGIELPALENVRRWYGKAKERSAFQAAVAHWVP